MDKQVAGRLRKRLAQMLVRSSCVTTSATTAFVTTNAATAVNARRHQEPPTLAATTTDNNKLNDGDSGQCHHRRRPQQRRRSSRERAPLVHISIDCSAAAAFPSPMPVKMQAKGRMRRTSNNNGKKMRAASSSYYGGWSSSSNDGETFSSDGEGDRRQLGGEAETTTTRSSTICFSSDSTSDFYCNSTIVGSKPRHSKPRRAPPPITRDLVVRKKQTTRSKQGDKISAAAVVKHSHDPYADFRSSMAEMAAGRSAQSLTELLVWYLSLNSPRHHHVILSAFHDVSSSLPSCYY